MACNSCKSHSCNGCGTPGVRPSTNPYYVPTAGCGLDPCVNIRLGTDSVTYTGQFLSCTNINTCDTLTSAIAKLNYAICNQPALQFTTDNGLTKTANNVQLGGTLIQKTVLTTSVANTLAIENLVTEPAPLFLVTQDANGVLKKTSISIIPPGSSSVTAINGLNKVGTDIKLGGTLVQATTIATNNTNTLSLTGLVTDIVPDFLLTQTTAGAVRKISASTFNSNILSAITATNGLTKLTNNIRLGGTLIQNTDVDLAGFNFSLIDNAPILTGVIIYSGLPNQTSYITNSTKIEGKLNVSDRSYFENNVGIGIKAEATAGTDGGTRLNIVKISNLGTNTTSRYFTFNPILGLRDTPTSTDPNFHTYASTASTLDVIFKTPRALNVNSIYSSVVGGINYGSEALITGQGLSAFTTSFSFGRNAPGAPTANLEKLIGYRVQPPAANAVTGGWSQTINTFIGVQIERGRKSMNGGVNGAITNSYGILQEGSDDINVFNSGANIFVNMPNYISDFDASVDLSLPNGSLYRVGKQVRVKL